MRVVIARLLLLAAAVAAAVLIPSDLVVEIAAGVVAGLVLELVRNRPKPPAPPAPPAVTPGSTPPAPPANTPDAEDHDR